MKIEEIYFWVLAVIAVLSFWYAVTHMPESYLEAVKQCGC